MTDTYGSAAALVFHTSPVDPVVCLRPQLIAARARRMLAAFPGDMLYAVKCNEAPEVLRALWDGGVREFDTASIGEVRAVKALLPAAACHFMHPIKSPEAIAEAYHRHGVRRFVLDHPDELAKILAATGGAGDLELFVRLAVPGEGSMLALTGKFGVGVEETAGLVRAARGHARSVGITFHVGSQCVEPMAFARAIALVAEVVRRAGPIDDLDVGGGFPARYLGDEPAFEAFVAAIREAVARHGLGCRLQCEPGRALVADGASVLARVELRRGLEPLSERRHLRQSRRAEMDRAAIPDAAGAADAPGRRAAAGLRPVRADLRQHRQHARPTLAAGRHRGRRLDRGRDDGRLLQLAAHPVQRVHQRADGAGERRRLVRRQASAAGPRTGRTPWRRDGSGRGRYGDPGRRPRIAAMQYEGWCK